MQRYVGVSSWSVGYILSREALWPRRPAGSEGRCAALWVPSESLMGCVRCAESTPQRLVHQVAAAAAASSSQQQPAAAAARSGSYSGSASASEVGCSSGKPRPKHPPAHMLCREGGVDVVASMTVLMEADCRKK